MLEQRQAREEPPLPLEVAQTVALVVRRSAAAPRRRRRRRGREGQGERSVRRVAVALEDQARLVAAVALVQVPEEPVHGGRIGGGAGRPRALEDAGALRA